MERVHVLLPLELIEAMESEADGRSRSLMVRRAVERAYGDGIASEPRSVTRGESGGAKGSLDTTDAPPRASSRPSEAAPGIPPELDKLLKPARALVPPQERPDRSGSEPIEDGWAA